MRNSHRVRSETTKNSARRVANRNKTKPDRSPGLGQVIVRGFPSTRPRNLATQSPDLGQATVQIRLSPTLTRCRANESPDLGHANVQISLSPTPTRNRANQSPDLGQAIVRISLLPTRTRDRAAQPTGLGQVKVRRRTGSASFRAIAAKTRVLDDSAFHGVA